MEWLLSILLLVALMIFLYWYGRGNKPKKLPRSYLLPGYGFSKDSWKSSSMTKGAEENQPEVAGENHDRNALEKIFRPRTDESAEKTHNVTIVVEDDIPDD